MNIALLQDTYWTPQLNNYITSEWGEVAILFNNTFEFEVKSTKIDINGNYLFLEVELSGILTVILGSIYGPNNDNPDFYHGLDALLKEFENPNVIMGGDWNFTLNQEIDNLHYKKTTILMHLIP